ncbi:MAG: GDP-mannose 4,6-dehydratase [Patescibacteria group bacterium]
MKKALITGITGQDGSYLAELLLEKGYEVYGIVRRSSERVSTRITHILDRVKIIEGDITDFESVLDIMRRVHPDEVYNLAAQSHVGYSFKAPIATLAASGESVLILLEAIREVDSKIKFYQASTSELYGGDLGTEPQNEKTVFNPHSPYAIAKLAAFHYVKLYRESYGMFACNGILFNHESPRRGEDFVTRKITRALTRVTLEKQEVLELGNTDAKRDWGFAGDYVEGMWRMLQADKPEDFVLATNETHTVREFVEKTWQHLGGTIIWEGTGKEETGKDEGTGKIIVRINPEFYRPGEVHLLLGDSTKARTVLGWDPQVGFEKLVAMMVDSDLELARKE